jgi:hypothetical protein
MIGYSIQSISAVKGGAASRGGTGAKQGKNTGKTRPPQFSWLSINGSIANRPAEAAAEFQKIIDHAGVVVSDPIGALARVRLGRSFAMAGDMNKARAAYQDFLTLWKEADPNIPILNQAKVEYATLQ